VGASILTQQTPHRACDRERIAPGTPCACRGAEASLLDWSSQAAVGEIEGRAHDIAWGRTTSRGALTRIVIADFANEPIVLATLRQLLS
jgi:hypothetical protein